MNNESNVFNELVSLPAGGGALQGIGEKFSPDLYTGTGHFIIPISVPQGRNDLSPQLQLEYSSGGGNGVFGLGWNLDIPCISRKTSKGIPIYNNEIDTFIMSDSEDLVKTSSETDYVLCYRSRTEGSFSKIKYNLEHNYWEILSQNGLTCYYGLDPEDNEQPINDGALIRNPERIDHIFSWKLKSTIDTFGNKIEYIYQRDALNDQPPQCWDQIYLTEIRYADYGERGNSKFLVSVRFVYEQRPDPFSDYRSGFEIRTCKRCSRIEIYSGENASVPGKIYYFTYYDSVRDSQSRLPANGISLLKSVRAAGFDGSSYEYMPSMEFDYTEFQPESRQYKPFSAVCGCMPGLSLAHEEFELVDLFGSGLPDLVQIDENIRYWRNLGNGLFDVPKTLDNSPFLPGNKSKGFVIGDMDGNGKADLLITGESVNGYYPFSFNGGWDERKFVSYRECPSFSLKDPQVKLVDLNVDGVMDALRTGDDFELYYNNAGQGWSKAEVIKRRDAENFPNVYFSDPRVKLADINGDGLCDIVLVQNGNMEYWPYMGYGRWGNRITMENSPTFEDSLAYSGIGFDPRRVILGDIDGDGAADLVYVGDNNITIWINRCGNSWSEPIKIHGTPSVDNTASIRLADMFGCGTPGILWSYDYSSQLDSTYKFLDFTGLTKPYLLNKIVNNMGATTVIDYSPSTKFCMDDRDDPETRWKTTLPFPVQVVSRILSIDAVSKGKLTTVFKYHHGYWDGIEREFRGFGFVERIDSEEFELYNRIGPNEPLEYDKLDDTMHFSKPSLTKTWFYQGLTGDRFEEQEELDQSCEYWPYDAVFFKLPENVKDFIDKLPQKEKRSCLRTLRGKEVRSELYSLDGTEYESKPYTVTENLYGVCLVNEDCGLPVLKYDFDKTSARQEAVFFPHLLVERKTQWERGDDPMTNVQFYDGYDSFGRSCRQTKAALPRRSGKQTPVTVFNHPEINLNETRILATHTRIQYAKPYGDTYIHDRIAQTREFELAAPFYVNERNPDDLASVLSDQLMASTQVHNTFNRFLDSWQYGFELPDGIRLVSHSINRYDGEAYEGCAIGELGPYGAVTRTENLVFTENELNNAYGTERPQFLGGQGKLPDAVPASISERTGYYLKSLSEEGYHHGYYMAGKSQKYDFQDDETSEKRGMVLGIKDSIGNESRIIPDRYRLFPEKIIDPQGLESTVLYDYRVMKPTSVTDPNLNKTHLVYSPLGMVLKQYLKGRNDEGGSENKPELLFEYDFSAFERTRGTLEPQPVYVHTISRIRHESDGISDDIAEQREYTDGFGRLIQKRIMVSPLAFEGQENGLSLKPGCAGNKAAAVTQNNRVIVSGWTFYDNKGQVIKKYEPAFSTGWNFCPGSEVKCGKYLTMLYDPVGRMTQTINSDGSRQRVVYGIPTELSKPDEFEPTPWEFYLYDANDLAPESILQDDILQDANQKTLKDRVNCMHYYTPANTLIDALGRSIAKIVRNGSNPCKDWYLNRLSYDIKGNPQIITDSFGRSAYRYVYDLMNRTLLEENIDSGLKCSIPDAAGSVIESFDGKGSAAYRSYDTKNRLTQVWARDNENSPFTLREKLLYGDSLDRDLAVSNNLVGRVYRHFDGAGLLQFESYDFKGNITRKTRYVIKDSVLSAGYVVDWSIEESENQLDTYQYTTEMEYDGLNRVTGIKMPADVSGSRSLRKVFYNVEGALEKIYINDKCYIDKIIYDAKGRRLIAVYGNGVMTRYAYDPFSFRLLRTRSEKIRCQKSDEGIWEGTGLKNDILQDFTYSYDLCGNITSIEDSTPNCGVAGSPDGRDRLLRTFEYDPVYRLVKGDGRACRNTGSYRRFEDVLTEGAYCGPGNPPVPNQDNAPDLTENYVENYTYDPAGNLIMLAYTAASGKWTRKFGISGLKPGDTGMAANNRMTGILQGDVKHSMEYDNSGNLILHDMEKNYFWDYSDRLVSFINRPTNSMNSSVEAHYLYSSDGTRVKKWVKTGAAAKIESTVYIDGNFEHHSWKEGNQTKQNNHVKAEDGNHGAVVWRTGDSYPDDAGPETQFHLGDHLGSSNVVTDKEGGWINREEYTPYGETSFGGFSKKCYRYNGKERDNESGLYYYGARYYAPFAARWLNCDPLGMVDGLNLYSYVRNNPMVFNDPTGMAAPSRADARNQKVYKNQVAGQRAAQGLNPLGFQKSSPGKGTTTTTAMPPSQLTTPPPPPQKPLTLQVEPGSQLPGPNIVPETDSVLTLPNGVAVSLGRGQTVRVGVGSAIDGIGMINTWFGPGGVKDNYNKLSEFLIYQSKLEFELNSIRLKEVSDGGMCDYELVKKPAPDYCETKALGEGMITNCYPVFGESWVSRNQRLLPSADFEEQMKRCFLGSEDCTYFLVPESNEYSNPEYIQVDKYFKNNYEAFMKEYSYLFQCRQNSAF
ncbi:MAG TPA: SpvB/TcaC N-terminal domain-containing protein [Clostridia bacterium]|nr:SpvB/TcaC N-terminal domain-containing protein [Clostridia bacterium]